MEWLRLGVLAVGSLTTFLMLLALTAYAAALRGKTPDTWFLLGYLLALCLLLGSYTMRYSLFTPAGLATGQVSNLIVFGIVSLIQFAYRYGGLDRPREARIVLALSLALASGAWGINFFLRSAPRVYDFEAEYFTFEYGPQISSFALAGYLWALVVLLRRAAGRGTDPGLRLSLLRFALLDLVTVGLASVYFLFQTGLLARAVYATVFNTASLLIALQIFVVYLNDAPQPSSFVAKLVGLPLAALLVAFGIASTSIAGVQQRILAERYLAEARAAAYNADILGSLALSPAVAYVAPAAADGAPTARYRGAGVAPGWPAAVASAPGRSGPLATPQAPARFVYLDLQDTRTFFFEYELGPQARRVRVGFFYADYRAAMHRVSSRIAVVVALAVLAVVGGFPMASRRGLLRPLGLLLEGVRQVHGGNYGVSVEVAAEDEIGELARSFNAMVRSVQQAEGSFKTLAESAGDAILVISEDGRILFVNRAAAGISGWSRDELLGRRFGALIAAGERERIEDRFAARMAGEALPAHSATRVLSRSGEEVAVELAAARTVWHERAAVVVILRDVRERLAAEERLREQAQQLSRADKLASVGVLVASVAHEVGNPTQAVAHEARFLAQGLPGVLALAAEAGTADAAVRVAGMPFAEFSAAAAAALHGIEASAARIERMVRDLKELTREGSPGAERAPVQVNDVVATVVELAGRFVRGATTRFSVSLGSDLPAVNGDRVRLEQVVLNLLQNACQALPDRERGVSVSTRLEGDVVMEVADEGVGIRPQDLARITEPFYTTRREQGGTGLGLVVADRIVREHGGRLLFRSEPGRGTVATVRLPTAVAASGVNLRL